MPIKFWRIPFHCYQSGGGSRFYRYFDDVTILFRILHLSEDLILWLSYSVILNLSLIFFQIKLLVVQAIVPIDGSILAQFTVCIDLSKNRKPI